MHLVDTTLFYSPTSGGIRRYLNAKHAWLKAHTAWEHSIVVPGPEDRVDRGDPEHLEENVKGASLKLSKEDFEALEHAVK